MQTCRAMTAHSGSTAENHSKSLAFVHSTACRMHAHIVLSKRNRFLQETRNNKQLRNTFFLTRNALFFFSFLVRKENNTWFPRNRKKPRSRNRKKRAQETARNKKNVNCLIAQGVCALSKDLFVAVISCSIGNSVGFLFVTYPPGSILVCDNAGAYFVKCQVIVSTTGQQRHGSLWNHPTVGVPVEEVGAVGSPRACGIVSGVPKRCTVAPSGVTVQAQQVHLWLPQYNLAHYVIITFLVDYSIQENPRL